MAKTKQNLGRILMGGSGSTGSSLLKNIFGRHSRIFASQETSILAKASLYTDWPTARRRLGRTHWLGLHNHGFHLYDRIDIDEEELLLSQSEALAHADAADSVLDFVDRLFGPALADREADIWLEKTPANAATLGHFLAADPSAYVIHTVRDPLDTIASLVARGQSPYYATSLYLLNTACAMAHRDHPRYLEIRYEDLVADPPTSIKKLCANLGIVYEEDMLIPQQEQHLKGTSLPSWQYDETAAIGRGSVRRFDKADATSKAKILHAIQHLSASTYAKKHYELDIHDVASIAQHYSYKLPQTQDEQTSAAFSKALRQAQKADRRHRRKYQLILGPKKIDIKD